MFPHPVLQRKTLHFPERRNRFLSSREDRRVVVHRTTGSPGYYYSSPVAADQKVYIASEEGVVVVLDAGEKFNVLATNKLDGTILATPALVDRNSYVRTENLLSALESEYVSLFRDV